MNKPIKSIVFILWAVLLVWGANGVLQRLLNGELVANYGSYVPWGLWVAAKVYFVGIGVGISLFVWVVFAFHIKRFYPITSTALLTAAISIGMGALVIAMDLGHMWRSFEVFYRPNFTSLLAWATWLTFIYLGYIILIFLTNLSPDPIPDHRKRILGGIGLFLGIVFSGCNGAEFGALISSPYWNSTLGPVSSIFGALLSGMALLLAITCLFFKEQAADFTDTIGWMSRIVVGLILTILVLEWAEYSISSWYGVGDAYMLRNHILFGPYWYVFWVIHIGIGCVLPLLLLLSGPANRFQAGFGGGLAAITFFAVRLNLVIPGQVTPAMKGLQEAYMDSRLTFTYLPSTTEWAVVAFFVAAGIAAFYLVNRILSVPGQSR